MITDWIGLHSVLLGTVHYLCLREGRWFSSNSGIWKIYSSPEVGILKNYPPVYVTGPKCNPPTPPPPLRTWRASGCEIAYNTCSFVKVKVSECALNFGCKFVVVYLHFRKNDSYMALASRTNLKFCCLRISIYALTILYYNYNWPRQMTRGWVLLLLNIRLHVKGFNKLIYIGTFK